MLLFIRLNRKALLFVFFILALSASTYGADEYEIIEIGTWGGIASNANQINNNGVIGGSAQLPSGAWRIFLWEDNLMREIPVPIGFSSMTVHDFNDALRMCGQAYISGKWHGFVDNTDLGFGIARAINDRGEVIGNDNGSAVRRGGFIYRDGSFRSLSPDYTQAEPWALNDFGSVVGSWRLSTPTGVPYQQAFLYRDSVILFGNMGGSVESSALDVNNRDQVVGSIRINRGTPTSPDIYTRGFLWENGSYVLMDAGNFRFSGLTAINDSGVAVGVGVRTTTPSSLDRVMIYDAEQGYRDLDSRIPANSGWVLGSVIDINNNGEIIGNGKHNGQQRGFLLRPAVSRFFILLDVDSTPIANTPVRILSVANDPPTYTETFLGVETTDSLGRIRVSRALRSPGQKVRFEILAHEQAAFKGRTWFKNLYSLRLDNMSFDELSGPSFHVITLDSVQEIVMNHTSIAINLVVSVQWDAELNYLSSLESGLQLTSNYLYDVTNGQAYFDTVRIYDNGANWNSADIQIYSNNQEWPRAFFASRTAGFGAFSNIGGVSLKMPRLFYFNSERANRELDWAIYPYNWSVPLTTFDFDGNGPRPPLSRSFCPSRTIAHELGHYFFGFLDEYIDADDNRVWPNFNYGMMDDQFIPGDIQSSELSTLWQYGTADKQVTAQWIVRGGSCWTWLESDMGEEHNGIQCPITKPDEIGPPGNVVVGPNFDVLAPDYDIGSKLVFPVVQTAPSVAVTKAARVQTLWGSAVEGAEVHIERHDSRGNTIINQGKTNADGRIRIVGYQPGDSIFSSSGSARLTGAAVAATAQSYADPDDHWFFSDGSDPSAVDSFVLASKLVDGYYPIVLQLAYSDSVSTQLQTASQGTLGDPTLGFNDGNGIYTDVPLEFDSVTSAYVSVVDGIGGAGIFSLRARDNSGDYFRIPGAFIRERVTGGAPEQFFSSNGEASISLDSTATSSGLKFVSILSTPYPIIQNYAYGNVLRVSETHSISTFPKGSIAGTTTLQIRYSSDGLSESEEQSIRIFMWSSYDQNWDLYGGNVDIERDEITSTETHQDGTFAAFTTVSPTGIDDDAVDNLPYKFSVSQNYPNPFNPATTISYSVPSHVHVTIEIFNVLGQKVRTLVNDAKSAGSYMISWTGTDDAGRSVSTGVYLYRFKAGDFVETKKMMLLQ